jgi:hypothetical protein
MAAFGPRSDGRVGASHRDPLGPAGPAGATDTGATIRAAAKLLSAIGPASREMSLWSPDRNLKTAATDFKEATKGPAGPEHERSECEAN